LPGVPASVAAAALAIAAAVAGFALSRPAPGEGPWRLSFPEAVSDPFWNATLSDGNWKLAAYAEGGLVRIKPDYANGDGLLDLAKPVSDGRGKAWKIASIGFPPLARDNPDLSHGTGGRLLGDVKEIRLPETLVELGEGALMNCGRVAEIDLPASLRRIGPWAFSGCRGLRRIVIPAGVEDVSGDRTFMGCTALEEIAVEEGNGEYRAVDGVLLSADGRRLVAYPPGRAAERYDVPEGVEAVPSHLFADCPALAEVSIPPSVSVIGHHAFAGCRALTNVVFAEGARVRLEGKPFVNTGLEALSRKRSPP
ncbi:MAG: leucine-rich repeat domain-containing protein, partial [Kiritimatiellae bacterium]|nr:leucine-rich repeat domain-containing protein [Kiritimatiellia bacterium]